MNRPPPTTGAHPDMIRLDSTGFPLVRCPAAKVWAGLLPVTKAQFDYFLGDRTGFDPATYELLMSTCPRASWRDIPEDRPEEVFLSGILPEEAVRFAKWLGGGFRVPSPHEWKAVDALLGTAGTDIDPLLEAAADPKTHPAARSILTWLRERRPGRWRALGFLEDGLLEWVGIPSEGYGLQGRPRPALFKAIHNPQAHEPIRPRAGARNRAFGVRLVCPLN